MYGSSSIDGYVDTTNVNFEIVFIMRHLSNFRKAAHFGDRDSDWTVFATENRFSIVALTYKRATINRHRRPKMLYSE